MSEEIQFQAWLSSVLPGSTPPDVIAYNFDVAEAGDWIVELIGASSYDENEEDWACPPARWHAPTCFSIPRKTATTWEAALAYVCEQVRSFISDSKSVKAGILHEAQAVCAGFVDGNLTLIWSRNIGSGDR